MQLPELTIEQRIKAFSILGGILRDAASGSGKSHAQGFSGLIENYFRTNPWFTPENVRLAIASAGEKLTEKNISGWLSRYPELADKRDPSVVGVVMAGNIPMVGFHDLLCVLITGNRLIVKPSSKDELLIKAVIECLIEFEPDLGSYIKMTRDKLSGFDMVIATGSDNTSRYFDYYFRNYHSLIRRNRNSVAVLDGSETDEEIEMLGRDIFSYFGLGCRSISKLYLPEGYDLNTLISRWNSYRDLLTHQKYAVNYDHNKAVMIVNRQAFTDTGYLLLRRDPSLTPPVAVLHYDFYSSGEALDRELEMKRNSIQCITGKGHIPFGKAQHPELWDYADDIDTILFLLKKNVVR